MGTMPQGDDISALEGQRPVALLAGLFVGFTSVLLTLGYLWPFAPLFPALVAGTAVVLPFKNGRQIARGAMHACLGVAAFEAIFVVILLLSLLLR